MDLNLTARVNARAELTRALNANRNRRGTLPMSVRLAAKSPEPKRKANFNRLSKKGDNVMIEPFARLKPAVANRSP